MFQWMFYQEWSLWVLKKKKQQKKTAFEIMNNELTSFDLILKLDVDERRTLSVQAFN